MTARGQIFVVGIGPGQRDLLTPQAAEAIRAAEVVIGYVGYFAWVADLVHGKQCVRFSLGQEQERAGAAFEHAGAGRRVAVISSGDPGIYAMASLVLEMLAGLDADARPDIVVVPGVSALNAAAALLGAPLGHDFAAISLSDLLTPWDVIEKRLTAAAAADFVLAFFNPKSQRRNWQLARAREILLAHRSPATPAGIVHNAFRPQQAIVRSTLAELNVGEVDMFSLVIVGNAASRLVGDFMLTPRGYFEGRGAKDKEKGRPGERETGRQGEGETGRPGDAEPGSASLSPCLPVSLSPCLPALSPCLPVSLSPLLPFSLSPCLSRPEDILGESFRIIESEVGPHSFDAGEWPIVRRMIHAAGDLDLVQAVRFHNDPAPAALQALARQTPIVTDVTMVLAGIHQPSATALGVPLRCFLNEPGVEPTAKQLGMTRSACGIERAIAEINDAIYVIGNAPTALLALCAAVRAGQVRPALIVAMPVGFVAVSESKEEALRLNVPVITLLGRKGGSAIAAATVNALLSLALKGDQP